MTQHFRAYIHLVREEQYRFGVEKLNSKDGREGLGDRRVGKVGLKVAIL
ncbi:MAG: hypothetical protein R3E32_07280 [Chitinophagales bacterium]